MRIRLALLLTLLLPAVPVWGQSARPGTGRQGSPPVYPTGTFPTQRYDEAAALAAVPGWGTAQDSRRTAHVPVDLDARRAMLTLVLSPDVNVVDASRWLDEADPLPLPIALAKLATFQSEAAFVQSEHDLPRSGFPASSRAVLHLERIGLHLPDVTDEPVLGCVRLAGADAAAVRPRPAYRVHYQGDEYLFYSLTGPTAPTGPIAVTYRPPARSLAAAVAAAGLWLFFPLGALLVVRGQAGRQQQLEPKQRVALYRRWRRMVNLVPMLVGLGCLFLMRSTSFLSYFGSGTSGSIFLASMAAWLGWALVGRVLGVPLEKIAWPQRARLPWHHAVRSELVNTTLFVVMVWGLLQLGSGTAVTAGGLRLGYEVMYLTPLLFLLVVRGCQIAVNLRRKRGALTGEVQGPPEVVEAVGLLSARCECPVNRLRVGKEREGLAVGSVTVLGDLAVIGRETVEALEPDQTAALVTAAALTLPRTTAERITTWIGSALVFIPALVLCGAALGSPALYGTTKLTLLILGQPAVFVGWMLLARQARGRQQRADLRAAEALDDPVRYVRALRTLEELQVATVGFDPGAGHRMPLAQRRFQLEQKLGLE